MRRELLGEETQERSEGVAVEGGWKPPRKPSRWGGASPPSARERRAWDPKDGELCPGRVKPEETLVEARSGSDVQIDCHIWV